MRKLSEEKDTTNTRRSKDTDIILVSDTNNGTNDVGEVVGVVAITNTRRAKVDDTNVGKTVVDLEVLLDR
jgi:hypothetical protein